MLTRRLKGAGDVVGVELDRPRDSGGYAVLFDEESEVL